MIDPFEEVEPVEPIDEFQLITSEIFRGMLWDMIGPEAMANKPTDFLQQPASPDVLEAEAKEMWARRSALLPFYMDLQLLSSLASEAASIALMGTQEHFKELSEQEKIEFRKANIKMGTAISGSVVSHLLQRGLLKYGEHQ